MNKFIIYIVCFLQFFFLFNVGIVNAEIGDIGHWRDSIGGQIPGTTFGGFNFDSEIRNDGIYTKPNDSTVEVTESGDYLIIVTTHDEDTSNGRYNPQLTISQTAGTGDVFSSNYSGYSRDNSENESWTRGVGIVIGATANSQFQVQKRSDTDVPTGGSVINSSDIQIVKLDQTNYGIYDIGGNGNIYGGTTPNTVDVTSILNESNTASIEGNIATDTITIKGDNKTYLVAWSVSFDSGNTRTQRIGHLEYDNVDSLSTRSYCYGRNTANEYCGLGSMDIIRTSTADIDLQTEVYRGDGVGADQGGADVDGTLATDGNGQIIVLEMPDSLEIFSSEDSVGLQDITTAQTLNIARDVNIGDTTSFTKASDTTINVTNPSDIFSWANIWTARSNIAAGTRQTSYGSIVIDGVEQTTGRHGNYSRGNQSTLDTFAMGFHPAGIFTTTLAGSTIGVNSTPLAGGEAGGNDRTQPGTLGFFAINLDTLIPPTSEPILGVIYSDNDVDNTVQTNQIVQYSIDIINSGADATGISAISPIDTNFGTPYGFTYGNCGSPNSSFTNPNLSFSNISILGGTTCNIIYYVVVDNLAPNGTNINSSVDISAAVEGGSDPGNLTGDTLNVIACGINDVNIIFETDDYGEDTFWSLTPNGNVCGVGEIANGGNPGLDCNSGGTPATAGTGDPYADASVISEGPFSLLVGNQYDLHVIDDYGDGITVGAGGTDPDVLIEQNGGNTDTFNVVNDGGIFTFTVQEPSACIDTINPEVSINQSPIQTDPTTINNITYQVIFNEPINIGTFTAGDITISGTTGIITSGPTEISPNNGSAFEFIVSGMTNGDTVSAIISAGVIEDLAGNLNNASSSIDNQVTYNGLASIIAPGGVSNNIQIWLKADQGPSTSIDGNTVSTWSDQSGNDFDAGAGVPPIYRNNPTDSLNYNPVVDFNGSTQYLENLGNGAYTHSYYAVVIPDNTVDGTLSGQVPLGFDCNSGILNTGTCGLTFAGVVLGAFTAAINDEVITNAIGSSVNWRSSQIGAASYSASQPMLIVANENTGASSTDIYEKGLKIDNYTANTYQNLSTANYRIGMSMDGANPFPYDGKIAEIVNYSTRTSDTDRQKIESYLGLKYGITLNSGTQNYIASDGSTNIWTTATAGTYIYDIFGIGRDDVSSLGQVKSKSSNSDGIITLEAVGEGTNSNPIFVDMIDNEFLTISNDGGGNTWTEIGAPSGYYILTRKWRAQETGEVGTVNLDFDVDNSNYNIPDLSLGTNYYFVYDSDNDNSLDDETAISMTNIGGSIWQIAGIDINNEREFTIATQASTNNIPTDISINSNNVDENTTIPSSVGDFSTVDADLLDTHTYTLVSGVGDDDNSLFSIIGNTLSIQTSPDFEIKNSYTIRVQTDDGNGGQYQEAFTIDINNIGEVIDSIIDFEQADDENRYSITSGTWNRNTNNPNEGSFSIESSNSGNNTQSCFEFVNTISSTGTLNFDYSVSSELGSDYLRFYIDNIEQGTGWSGTIPYTNYINNNIPAGTHSYKWCYIKDGGGAGGTDNAYIDYITLESSITDITPPNITSINFASGSLLPGGNQNIVIDYNDIDTGMDISSDSISLFKWDGVSSWGPDISTTGLNLGSKTITSSQATYSTNNLSFGKYRYDFSIDDINTNTSSTGAVFYIDEPELIISTGSINLGSLTGETLDFSNDEITITVKTIGAGFYVKLSKDTSFSTSGGGIIIDWDGSTGVGYDKTPYSGVNLDINNNQDIASQTTSINTNGLKNTYNYSVKIGTLLSNNQAAGDYSMNLSFYLIMNY